MTTTLWAGLWRARSYPPRRPVGGSAVCPARSKHISQCAEETSRVVQHIDLADP
jgi:hypothetical protein